MCLPRAKCPCVDLNKLEASLGHAHWCDRSGPDRWQRGAVAGASGPRGPGQLVERSRSSTTHSTSPACLTVVTLNRAGTSSPASGNSFLPEPSSTGKIIRLYWSTRSFEASRCTSWELPATRMSRAALSLSAEPVKLNETSGGWFYLTGLLGLDGGAGLVDPHLGGQGRGCRAPAAEPVRAGGEGVV